MYGLTAGEIVEDRLGRLKVGRVVHGDSDPASDEADRVFAQHYRGDPLGFEGQSQRVGVSEGWKGGDGFHRTRPKYNP